MIHLILTNHFKLITPVIVLFLGIFFQDKLQYMYSNYVKGLKETNDEFGSFTAESLARFNGVTEKKLYMSVLGIVFDVSEGAQHYAKGAPYHYFVGKDGSRALVTGNFKDESDNKDHVLDLSCTDILTILNWRETLEKKYKKIGILAGKYYEINGGRTAYLLEFVRKIDECLGHKEEDKKLDMKYPPCNIAWSEHEGTKVWCTKTSGGIYRDWIGVPRQLYTPGQQKPRCVCINTKDKHDASAGLLKEYEDCANTSVVCFVNQ